MCKPTEKRTLLRQQDHHQQILGLWIFPIIVSGLLWPLAAVWRLVGDTVLWGILGRTYLYNMSWEDPRIDRRQFNLDETDHVVTLASAGAILNSNFRRRRHIWAISASEGELACSTRQAIRPTDL